MTAEKVENAERVVEVLEHKTRDNCYNHKQASFDYEGAVPSNEDRADWYKPPLRVMSVIR